VLGLITVVLVAGSFHTKHMIDLILIALYLIATLWLGVRTSRDIRTMRDFSIAGRNYPTFFIIATIFATWVGGGAMLGGTERVYSVGVIFSLASIGDILSLFIIAKVFAAKVSKCEHALSVGDIMYGCYGTEAKVITGIAGMLYAVGAIGMQVSALGFTFQHFLNMPYSWGVWIGCGIVIIYSTCGGIRAVTITDVLQFGVLVVAVPIIANLALQHVGGYEGLFAKVPETHFSLFPQNENESLLKYVSLLIIYALPFLDPAIVQRLLMAKSSKQAVFSMTMASAISIPFAILIAIIGLSALSLYPGIQSDLALPHLIDRVIPVGFKGLAIAGILAIIMSTADSFFNTASISLVHDVITPFSKISDRTQLLLARISTIVLGLLSIAFALSFGNLIEMGAYVCNFWGPIVMFPLWMGIFGVRARKATFIIAVSAGFATFVVWEIFSLEKKFSYVNSVVPGLIINALSFYVAHRILGRMSDKEIEELRAKTGMNGKAQERSEKSIPISRGYGKNQVVMVSASRGSRFFYSIKKPFVLALDAIRNFRFKQIPTFSQRKVESYGAQYVSFGTFAVINYIMPFFMWSQVHPEEHMVLSLRLTAGIMCFMLLSKDLWPLSWQKYLPLYWHITLGFCLPFLTTYMLLDEHASLFWLMNVTLAIFFLSILVDWISFMIIFAVGATAGFLFYFLINGSPSFVALSKENIFISAYMYFFSMLIGIVFSKNREFLQEMKLRAMKSLSGIVSNELRTPLVAISIRAQSLEMQLEDLEKNIRNDVPEKYITANILNNLSLVKGSPNKITKLAASTSTALDIVLFNLEDKKLSFDDLVPVSVAECVEEALKAFPFMGNERSYVHFISDPTEKETGISAIDIAIKNEKLISDFTFMGSKIHMVHAIFNLMKNALYQIKIFQKGEIYIWLAKDKSNNYEIHVRDTATGIDQEIQSKLFQPLYSEKPSGAGLGLAFCKSIMETFNGEISFHSQKGEYAEFVLTFPSAANIRSSLKQK